MAERIFCEKTKIWCIFSWSLVLGLSTLSSVVFVPSSFFSNAENILNVLFVKWAWGWTLYSLFPAVVLVSWALRDDFRQNSIRAILKIGVFGTLVWFLGTQFTFKLGDLTGTCRDANFSAVSSYATKRLCRSNGHTWDHFDISGHTFLLSWCIYLTIAELFYPAREFFKRTHSFILEVLTVLAIAWNFLLVLLWLVMLVATQLYFHTFAEKVLAKLLCDVFFIFYRLAGDLVNRLLPLSKAKNY
ncbi:Oidioi.mRNA.OKI2018_I69.PAR.g13057.t1.cds [Oikopleura dioica]|uniref:Oidioi.mRNA.OKI2018_I69.PAR.g13057.t1.cds n=1 Tax=Oikopleura dioica TaxID=34765 RepID=A0ABN7S6E9_OIKDI|nr:Oidioi.mRNA.OKI2018_I69.PAR.g13057.t1.cds [Oikopleura dioica]